MNYKDIYYETYSYAEIQQWINESVPIGTLPENIQIQFEIDEEQDQYYDQHYIVAKMNLIIKEEV